MDSHSQELKGGENKIGENEEPIYENVTTDEQSGVDPPKRNFQDELKQKLAERSKCCEN